MGSGASLPDTFDEESARTAAGDRWDKKKFDELAVDGLITRDQLLGSTVAGSSLQADLRLRVGDIVQAKPEGMPLFCEGVIVSVNDEGSYQVDFGGSTGENSQSIPPTDIRKVRNWDHLEVGDQVKVKGIGTSLQFEAIIQEFDESTETYTVYYGEEEGEESGVVASRVNKVASGRLSAEARWTQLKNAVRLIGLLNQATKADRN